MNTLSLEFVPFMDKNLKLINDLDEPRDHLIKVFNKRSDNKTNLFYIILVLKIRFYNIMHN